jgi:hypothetical protein
MDLPFFFKNCFGSAQVPHTAKRSTCPAGGPVKPCSAQTDGRNVRFLQWQKIWRRANKSMNIINGRIMGLMPRARVLSPIQKVERRRMNGRIRLVDTQGWPWNASWQEFVGYLWIWPIFKREKSAISKNGEQMMGIQRSKNGDLFHGLLKCQESASLSISPMKNWSPTTEAEAWSATHSGLPGVQSQLGCSMASGGPMKPMFHGHSSA